CYAENYGNVPADGSASEESKDCLRVDRGGSWLYRAWLLRPATRERNPADYRDVIMGFRVAKTIDDTKTTPGVSATSAEPSPRVVDLQASDGTVLKASYFAAAKPGPGVLLYHQSNRTRKEWDDVAHQLAAAGINVLTVDIDPNKTRKQRWPGELEAAFEFLVSQPG